MAKTEITAEPGTAQVTVTREFEAPRDLVFRAYTDPDLIPRWLGPRDLTTTITEYDVRDGGRYRYIHTDADGNEYAFRGVFHGTPTPELTVQTFEFEGMPGHIALDAVTMVEQDGRTLVRTLSSFQSVEDRDGIVESGMETGIRDSDERLEALLVELQGAA
ncbi:SRPBCC family protein [Cryptosporangium minutisporangium]|uniref:SRPBCC family protein n=1 Tax=Cryptosporangium minutisporangium TaxID=113569 RepID=A0ABP6STX3_9ACTN